ncbi:MAG: hypothetical protein D6737_15665 [Chloroflexi bacterium]|nr:MAG: hypothetical protein CUN54_01125 [Phototrophicales bacterium]RMF78124.1 MAG: hypothetical protein D6737_15665 [Chloroflexota bacterium]
MLDDLRKSTLDDELEEFDSFDDQFMPTEAPKSNRGFLGMTPVERMFIAIFFFMNIFILGLALLIATDRISF